MIKKKLAFDIDGVICFSKDSNYDNSQPNRKAINKINNLYKEGHKIIIFTARYMGRTNGNKEEAIKLGYKKTLVQLKNWGLNYHELIFGKPSYDIFIDDKAYNYSEDWINLIDLK